MALRVKTDWALTVTIGVLVVFGLVMLFSASSVMSQERYKSSWFLVSRQFGWAIVATGALLFFKTREELAELLKKLSHSAENNKDIWHKLFSKI